MEKLSANYFKNYLYNEENGFLIKYHFEKGIDSKLLDELYNALEELKSAWKEKKEIPKDIVFHLTGIVPALYMDLPLYQEKPGCEGYEDLIYALNTAIIMCLNPDISDPFFNKPLKELGI